MYNSNVTRLQLSEIERFKVSREIEKERVLSLSCEVYFERGRRLRECWDMLRKMLRVAEGERVFYFKGRSA